MASKETPVAQPLVDDITSATLKLQSPFTCSGSLTLSTAINVSCPPPEVLWVKFPASEEHLQRLSALCQEATFGKGQKDVLDPSYRKALALGNDKFLTNFDLAAQDILTTIKAVMMPDAASIRAALYKLNIYRPGDFFKAHVDTPRGQGMFGSLVVCLPQNHAGGALLVRHKGTEQRFDFATASADTVQWAAFYSDCEHEILPVESGHRITLTYNLYTAATTQPTGPHLPGLDSSSLPLHRALVSALASPDFMPDGGELAVPCEHVYPHTQEKLLQDLPAMLKGQDALCYKVLQQLGLETKLQAVHDFREEYERRHADEGVEESEGEEEEEESDDDEDWNYQSSGNEEGSEEDGEEEMAKESIKPAKKAKVEKDGVTQPAKKGKVDKTMRVGDLMPIKLSNCGRDEDSGCFDINYFVKKSYRETRPLSNVVWLKDKEALKYQTQTVIGVWGNCISTEAWYSAAAVFASVPAWGSEKRAQLVQQLSLA